MENIAVNKVIACGPPTWTSTSSTQTRPWPAPQCDAAATASDAGDIS